MIQGSQYRGPDGHREYRTTKSQMLCFRLDNSQPIYPVRNSTQAYEDKLGVVGSGLITISKTTSYAKSPLSKQTTKRFPSKVYKVPKRSIEEFG